MLNYTTRRMPDQTSLSNTHLSAAAPALAPFHHVVQFYEDDGFLVESVARFLDTAIAERGAAIVIATAKHRAALAEELAARGLDVSAAVRQGSYVDFDAGEMLAKFMVNGYPDEARFAAVLPPVLANAQAMGTGRVAVFGEMVALLWGNGNREAAIRLEQLWNELAHKVDFSLFCGYPMSSFEREADRKLFFRVCGEHSEVTPTEEYPLFGSEKQRRRRVASLQQQTRALQYKTRALEREIRISRERILLLQEASGVGTWEMDLDEDVLTFSSAAAKMLQVSVHPLPLLQFVDLIPYSGDRDRFLSALQRVKTGHKEFVTEFRIHVDGGVRVLAIRGKAVYNSGQPLILGVLSNLTPQPTR